MKTKNMTVLYLLHVIGTCSLLSLFCLLLISYYFYVQSLTLIFGGVCILAEVTISKIEKQPEPKVPESLFQKISKPQIFIPIVVLCLVISSGLVATIKFHYCSRIAGIKIPLNARISIFWQDFPGFVGSETNFSAKMVMNKKHLNALVEPFVPESDDNVMVVGDSSRAGLPIKVLQPALEDQPWALKEGQQLPHDFTGCTVSEKEHGYFLGWKPDETKNHWSDEGNISTKAYVDVFIDLSNPRKSTVYLEYSLLLSDYRKLYTK